MGRRSASRASSMSRTAVKRDTLEGGRGRGRRKASRQPEWLPLLRRLRRVELAVAMLLRPERFSAKDMKMLDSFVSDVITFSADAGRSPDQRGEVSVPQEGAAAGEDS